MGAREGDTEISGVLVNCFISRFLVSHVTWKLIHSAILKDLIAVQCSEEATWKRNEQG